jgi:hypothetical protein
VNSNSPCARLFASGGRWDEALVGMRVGGSRRMLVPPSAIPSSQVMNVPGEQRFLRFDFELIGTLDTSTLKGWVAATLPPVARRVEIGRQLYLACLLASFVPYFLPVDMCACHAPRPDRGA